MDPKLIVFLLVISAVSIGWNARPVFSAWLRARRSGAPVSLFTLWRMYFLNVPLEAVMDAHVAARAAGIRIRLAELEAHARAGGDIRAVVRAYIETLRAGSRIDFARVCEIELEED